VRVVKAVKQCYEPTSEILGLLEEFRLMLNDCVRVGIKENITSMKTLSLRTYHMLSQYDVYSQYRLTAISKAAGILKNYRRELRQNPHRMMPYVKRLVLVDCYGFVVKGNQVRLTLRANEYAYIELTSHTLAMISRHALRSLTLTDRALIFAYSKEVTEAKPLGWIGVDCNLNNQTVARTHGEVETFDLSKTTRIRGHYREVKSHVKRNDVRIRRRLFQKYGALQRNKVGWILNYISASIVKEARKKQFGIVMEDLKGIKKMYRKGNGQGADHRSKMNSWSFAELQRQIEYKARWEGLTVIHVVARGTSSTCSICGGRTCQSPNGPRLLECMNCRMTFDRDENAARNILAKGALRFSANGPPGEAMVAEREQTPATPIRTVDGGKRVHTP
jgi:putative transposase